MPDNRNMLAIASGATLGGSFYGGVAGMMTIGLSGRGFTHSPLAIPVAVFMSIHGLIFGSLFAYGSCTQPKTDRKTLIKNISFFVLAGLVIDASIIAMLILREQQLALNPTVNTLCLNASYTCDVCNTTFTLLSCNPFNNCYPQNFTQNINETFAQTFNSITTTTCYDVAAYFLSPKTAAILTGGTTVSALLGYGFWKKCKQPVTEPDPAAPLCYVNGHHYARV